MADKKNEGASAEKVTGAIKVDIDAPESPIVHPDFAEKGAVEAKDPEKREVKDGETAAMHESHVLLSSRAKINERIEEEQKTGLPTDVIARRQQEDAAQLENQRVTAAGGDAALADRLRKQEEAQRDPLNAPGLEAQATGQPSSRSSASSSSSSASKPSTARSETSVPKESSAPKGASASKK